MIKISEYQASELRATRLHRFIEELTERAHVRHRARCLQLSDGDLFASMKTEVAAAKKFGLQTRGELKRFTDLAMTFGFGFSQNEDWARNTFVNKKQEPKARLRTVEETAIFVLRDRS